MPFQIASVERFVKSVNGTLRSRQDAERLQAIAERIECYDVVVSLWFFTLSVTAECCKRQKAVAWQNVVKGSVHARILLRVYCFCLYEGNPGRRIRVNRQVSLQIGFVPSHAWLSLIQTMAPL